MTNQKKAQNRFLAMPMRKQVLLISATLLVLFALLETAIWGASLAVYHGAGKQLVPLRMIENFHPLWHGPLEKVSAQTAYHPYLLYQPLPNLRPDRTKLPPDRHALIVDGNADSTRDLSLPGSRYRVFVLGGSTVVGQHSYDTLAHHIHSKLETVAPGRFEIITAGWSGWATWQELLKLQNELIYLHPDMIITFDGVNDASQGMLLSDYTRNDHVRGDALIAKLGEGINRGNNAITVDGIALLQFMNRFYSFALLVRVLELAGVDVPDRIEVADEFLTEVIYDRENPKHRTEAVEAYLENIMSMSAMAQARDIASLHVLQPTLAVEIMRRGLENVEHEVLARMEIPFKVGADGQVYAELMAKFFAAAQARFMDQSSVKALTDDNLWIDMSGLFADVEDLTDVYYDYTHYNTSAAKQIGEELAALVLQIAGQEPIENGTP